MKKIMIFNKMDLVLILIFFIMLSSLSLAVEYDHSMLDLFNSTSEIPVIVKTYDMNMDKVNIILNKLSPDEFILGGKFTNGRGFYGNITRIGFEKLLINSNVKSIYLDGEAHTTNSLSYLIPVNNTIILNVLNSSEIQTNQTFNNQETDVKPSIIKEENRSWLKMLFDFIKKILNNL